MKHLFTNYLYKVFSYSLLILITVNLAGAQNMTPGFSMLEKGKFNDAKEFFGNILQEDPVNPTALICYGRATGLSGNVEEAQEIFNGLLSKKPDNVEVLLNLAESHLWGGNGKDAAKIYGDILHQDPKNFAALLGYANSKSILKEYAQAYEYIQKALEVQPDNEQAAISRKFIRLGYADYLASQKAQYDEALEFVNANLADNKADQQSLMLKATIHLLEEEFEKADKIYKEGITDQLDAYIGKSTTTHLLKRDKEALQIVEEGIEVISLTGNEAKLLRIKLQYVSALLWNNKLKEASNYVEQLIKENPDNADLLATKAQVVIYMSDYKQGIELYEKFLQKKPGSFSGNLGLADANHALGMDNIAYKGAFRTLGYFPGQKDVLGFINRLNAIHAPELKGKLIASKTSDNSQRLKKMITSKVSLSPLWSVSAGYAQEVFSDTNGEDINVSSVTLSSSYRVNGWLKFDANWEPASAKGGDGFDESFSNHLIQAVIKPNKTHLLTLAQQRELQNFNKNLLLQNITMNHIILKNSSFWKLQNMGWYTEIYRSNFSDGNNRNLLFTSVYKNILNKPGVKTGLNFSAMSFDESKPTEYYSPRSFKNYEWFIGLNVNQTKEFPIKIAADFAAGLQVSDGINTKAWRAKIEISRQMNRLMMKAHAQHNSLSAVTNNGFSFSQASFTISYSLTKRPLFYNKYSKTK